MKKKAGKMLILTVVLLLFLPVVAVYLEQSEKDRTFVCREVPRQELTVGNDTAVSSRLFLLPGEKVNINTASQAELKLLPGIGETLAERITQYREAQGGFRAPEEIMQVKGIGQTRYNEIREMICVGDDR